MAQLSSLEEQLITPSNQNQNQNESEQQQQQQQNEEESSMMNITAEAIKFITDKFQSSFDEKSAKKLFNFYSIDVNNNQSRLLAPDVRKLLFDILSSQHWPLVVPDESLDSVLHELCLNDKNNISWIEFKSFFVFLQDRPLFKLFQICTQYFNKNNLQNARWINIKPINANYSILNHDSINNNNNNNDNNDDNNNNNNNNNNNDENKQNQNELNYDRKPWDQAIRNLIPLAQTIFLYFIGSEELLALVIGDFDSPLLQPAKAEITIDDKFKYHAIMRAFDPIKDIFPPIARAGGFKSKVARQIADSYLVAKKWDENHLKLAEKTSVAAKKITTKWKEIDDKYKVQQKLSQTTNTIINSVKAFDEKHQISRKMSATAKELDEKYKISEKVKNTVEKIEANETYQKVSNAVKTNVANAIQTVDEISNETQQLVTEKQHPSSAKLGQSAEQIENSENHEGNNNNTQ